jgi:hypothetical protein
LIDANTYIGLYYYVKQDLPKAKESFQKVLVLVFKGLIAALQSEPQRTLRSKLQGSV